MPPRNISREELVAGLIRAGEREVTGEDDAELDAYFAPDYAFHGPDGTELDYEGLQGFFRVVASSFRRPDHQARDHPSWRVTTSRCQTKIAGTFAREFTHSPVGPLPPNSKRVAFELINIFRYDEEGQIPEESIRPTIEAGCVSWAPKAAEEPSTRTAA